MNYTLKQISKIVGGCLVGNGDLRVNGIVTDSRGAGLGIGKMFVALKGDNHDGHKYIADLQQVGVSAFLVDHYDDTIVGDHECVGFVVVENTLKALHILAEYHRKSFKSKVIAVTGSNGKTIVKEWLAQLCPDSYKLFRSPRSYNSQVGVPLSLLMADGDEDFVVIEAGISKPGEMAILERMIKPDVGVITNIGDAHSENFQSSDQKLSEKLKLFKECKTIIFNEDNDILSVAVNSTFSNRNILRISVKKSIIRTNDLSEIKVDLSDLPFADEASKENALVAIATLFSVGVSAQNYSANLKKLQPVAMRLELKEGIGNCKIINDTYNSDINSLRLALGYMNSVAAGQASILILSDIFQSGYAERELYSKVAKMLCEAGVKQLIGIGEGLIRNADLFECEKEFFVSTSAFIATFDRHKFHDKTILIKGSRVYQFEKISRVLEKKIHTTVLEVNLDAMSHNLNYLRSLLKHNTKVMAMVKGFSYGMGGYEVSAMLENQRVDYLAVAYADEGITLREAGIKIPIVVLNADSQSFAQMITYRLEPEIYSLKSLDQFIAEVDRFGEDGYPIHIKLDTGMHRFGFEQQDIDLMLDKIKGTNRVSVTSVFSHLSVAESADNNDVTFRQIANFDMLSQGILDAFPDKKILRHIANSAAIERFQLANFDMVRLGIGLYGISAVEDANLLNVSVLKSHIVQLREVDAGEYVGYGRKGLVAKKSIIATVAIGYADGLDRRLSCGRWKINVGGVLAPIVGNVCMDTCMIDVTGLDAKEGDEVEVFGELNTVSNMATVLDTISYEVMTGISARVKRVFLKE